MSTRHRRADPAPRPGAHPHGRPNAPLLSEESVLGMRASIERFTLADTGRFFRYDGTEIPW
ncbi:MAG: hypothetical protein ACOY4L_05775 [Pseudomonadota bacterium]